MKKLVKETSAELRRKKEKKILFRYLAISAFCGVFFLVYNRFSHGIYSFWMTFLFAWPLVLGALPAALQLRGILPEVEPQMQARAPEGSQTRATAAQKAGEQERRNGPGQGPQTRAAAAQKAGEQERRDSPGKGKGPQEIRAQEKGKKTEKTGGRKEDRFAELFEEPGGLQKDIYRFGIAAVTVGSLLRGVLDIAGTYSRHTTFLLCAGALLLLAGGISYMLQLHDSVSKTK